MAHNSIFLSKGVTASQLQHSSLSAFTLVETLISMSLIAVIFVLVMQAFSSLTLGSYLVDARTSVRNEGEFIGEYIKLRIKNADPRTLVCNNAENNKEIKWQSKGSSDEYVLFVGSSSSGNARFCIDNQSQQGTSSCDTVLSYDDVTIKSVNITCDSKTDEVTGEQFTTVNMSFAMDSTVKLGERPAVKDVSRFVSVAIR